MFTTITKSDDGERSNDDIFYEKWGWYNSLYELAGDNLDLRNKWLKTNILDFLNHLSYKKEKSNMENSNSK